MLPQGSSSRSRVILDLSKYFGHNTPPKHLRLKRSTRLPAASRWRHVPPTQQPYDVPPNERVPCPTRRAESVESARPGTGPLAPRGGGESYPKNSCDSRPPRGLPPPRGGSTLSPHNSPTICRRKNGRRRMTPRAGASRGRGCSLPGVASLLYNAPR